jgi:processive 1,2-diacylglycerol beta-glucosyltransferase
MKPRVLILTAGFGEGHNAAARALSAAFTAAHGPGSARVADVFALASPRLNGVARSVYLTLINRAPRVWSAVYAGAERLPPASRAWRLLHREQRCLADLIAETSPNLLCSTYPVYAYLLARLAGTPCATLPHFAVVTDSISINALWWRAGCDGWFMPNEASADVLGRAGIASDRLHVCGFPVAAFFAANREHLSPPDLAAGGAPRVLYLVHSGTRHARETAHRLLAETAWEVTCAVGRDEALRRELQPLVTARSRPARIIGWTDEVPRLLMTHHVVVSKAGGATTQEAIAARCPMVVNQIVPGQEEGNFELLRRHRAGAFADTPDAVMAELRGAFAEGGRRWRNWRTALETISRPDAAQLIAVRMLELAGIEPAPVPLAVTP